MKIISWNVNGLVACKRKGFLKVLANSKADVFCCQEIKVQCPLSTPSYLQFWNPAQRPGYSGTLTLARKKPLSIRYGLGIEEFDIEGRLIALEYESYYIINVYVPNSQSGQERLDFRTAWDVALLDFLIKLDKPVIVCGDFNVARDYIDVYPENLDNEESPLGFTSEEREGMEQLLNAGYIDVFRMLYPHKEGAYTWWSMRRNKRLENRGWRLDYFIISEALLSSVKDIVHHTDILGSDHCPISLTFQAVTTRKKISAEDLADMWRGIDWDKMENQMLAVQQKISRAAYTGRWEDVTRLQKQLVRSLAAKTLAVRHVVKNDSEAGIDGVKWKTEDEMMRAALSLTSKGYRAKPYRRIIITENGKDRTIDVPTAYDKAMQALYSYSLDPVAEATADRKSFAARKGRSSFDAHVYLCMALEGDNAPNWICKGDIQACFSSINHRWILRNIPMDKKVLQEFLRAGAVYNKTISPTNQGVSQGASLSHTISNMTLDGLQSYIYTHLHPKRKNDCQNGELFRFVDDLIVTARTAEQAQEIIRIIGNFLVERGLKLHPDKTYISNTNQGLKARERGRKTAQKSRECKYVANKSHNTLLRCLRQ